MSTVEIDKLFRDFYNLNEKATRILHEVKYVENLGTIIPTETIEEITRLAQLFLNNARNNYGSESNIIAERLISKWALFKTVKGRQIKIN